MKITQDWVKKNEPCQAALDWWDKKERNPIVILKKLIQDNHLQWANWTIVRVMNYKQYVSYAVYAAEQVIDLYEQKYPEDKRPRQAIEAAKKCIKKTTNENKTAANAADAANAAHAAYAAHAADAAYAAANAAYAAYAANATYAAHAAAYAAYAAYSAHAAYAANAAYAMKLKILNYGLKLLKNKSSMAVEVRGQEILKRLTNTK